MGPRIDGGSQLLAVDYTVSVSYILARETDQLHPYRAEGLEAHARTNGGAHSGQGKPLC